MRFEGILLIVVPWVSFAGEKFGVVNIWSGRVTLPHSADDCRHSLLIRWHNILAIVSKVLAYSCIIQ